MMSKGLLRYCLTVLLVVALAGADEAGFRHADSSRQWEFPRDHGRHDAYKTEWWYFTGNLHTKSGRPFGFQLTFFRRGLSPEPPNRPSTWATHAVYIGHAHVADIQSKRYIHDDRISRGRAGLAGADATTLDVFIRQWSAQLDGETITLVAGGKGFELNLRCRPIRAPLLQGKDGLSPKSHRPGYASHYYSITRMDTQGTITVDGERFEVSGLSWMDHEFSSQQLDPQQVGWDWMSLQLDDGRDVMVYRMRNARGATDFAFASRLDADGNRQVYESPQIKLTPGRTWTSPDSGGVYPMTWEVALGDMAPLTVQTRFDDQEMQVADSIGFSYYEGAVEVTDERGQRIGLGYIEMTGYDRPLSFR